MMYAKRHSNFFKSAFFFCCLFFVFLFVFTALPAGMFGGAPVSADTWDTDYRPAENDMYWSAAVAVYGVRDGKSKNAYDYGSHKDNPFVITTPEQLIFMSMDVNSGNNTMCYYELAADITFAKPDQIETQKNFVPIGTAEHPFEGSFSVKWLPANENRYYEINGLNVKADCAGLFGYVKNALITGVTLGRFYGSIRGRIYAGGIAGYVMRGAWETVINFCSNMTPVYSCGNNTNSIGGLVGCSEGNLKILNSANHARLAAIPGFSVEAAGGILGKGQAVIERCANYGNSEASRYSGGIAGYLTINDLGVCRVANCSSFGAVLTSFAAGGIVGGADPGFYDSAVEITDCVYSQDFGSGYVSTGLLVLTGIAAGTCRKVQVRNFLYVKLFDQITSPYIATDLGGCQIENAYTMTRPSIGGEYDYGSGLPGFSGIFSIATYESPGSFPPQIYVRAMLPNSDLRDYAQGFFLLYDFFNFYRNTEISASAPGYDIAVDVKYGTEYIVGDLFGTLPDAVRARGTLQNPLVIDSPERFQMIRFFTAQGYDFSGVNLAVVPDTSSDPASQGIDFSGGRLLSTQTGRFRGKLYSRNGFWALSGIRLEYGPIFDSIGDAVFKDIRFECVQANGGFLARSVYGAAAGGKVTIENCMFTISGLKPLLEYGFGAGALFHSVFNDTTVEINDSLISSSFAYSGDIVCGGVAYISYGTISLYRCAVAVDTSAAQSAAAGGIAVTADNRSTFSAKETIFSLNCPNATAGIILCSANLIAEEPDPSGFDVICLQPGIPAYGDKPQWTGGENFTCGITPVLNGVDFPAQYKLNQGFGILTAKFAYLNAAPPRIASLTHDTDMLRARQDGGPTVYDFIRKTDTARFSAKLTVPAGGANFTLDVPVSFPVNIYNTVKITGEARMPYNGTKQFVLGRSDIERLVSEGRLRVDGLEERHHIESIAVRTVSKNANEETQAALDIVSFRICTDAGTEVPSGEYAFDPTGFTFFIDRLPGILTTLPLSLEYGDSAEDFYEMVMNAKFLLNFKAVDGEPVDYTGAVMSTLSGFPDNPAVDAVPDLSPGSRLAFIELDETRNPNYYIQSLPFMITVSKAPIEISVSETTVKEFTYNGAEQLCIPEFTGASGPVPYVLEISGAGTAIKYPGAYTVKVVVSGTDYKLTGADTFTVNVAKAQLTVYCDSVVVDEGEVPQFTIRYAGFAGADTAETLTKPASVKVKVQGSSDASKPGVYDLELTGAEAENYTITYIVGKLYVHAVKLETEDKKAEFEGSFEPGVTAVAVKVDKNSEAYKAAEAQYRKYLESNKQINSNLNMFSLYDISFYKDGIKVQPTSETSIRINTDDCAGNKYYSIAHLRADGTVEILRGTFNADYIEFSTDSLSFFGILEEKPGGPAGGIWLWLPLALAALLIAYFVSRILINRQTLDAVTDRGIDLESESKQEAPPVMLLQDAQAAIANRPEVPPPYKPHKPKGKTSETEDAAKDADATGSAAAGSDNAGSYAAENARHKPSGKEKADAGKCETAAAQSDAGAHVSGASADPAVLKPQDTDSRKVVTITAPSAVTIAYGTPDAPVSAPPPAPLFVPKEGGAAKEPKDAVEELVIKNADDIADDPIINRLISLRTPQKMTPKQIAVYAASMAGPVPALTAEYKKSRLLFFAGKHIAAVSEYREGVQRLTLRADTKFMDAARLLHPGITAASIPGFYSAVIDDTFTDALEIKDMLRCAYETTVAEMYKKSSNGKYGTDAAAAEKLNAAVCAEADSTADSKEFTQAVETKKMRKGFVFVSKKEVVDYALSLGGGMVVTAAVRKEHRPTSLKCASPTPFLFAAENHGITRLIFRATSGYAAELMKKHTLRPVGYLEPETWYSMALGYSFASFTDVKSVIDTLYLGAVNKSVSRKKG